MANSGLGRDRSNEYRNYEVVSLNMEDCLLLQEGDVEDFKIERLPNGGVKFEGVCTGARVKDLLYVLGLPDIDTQDLLKQITQDKMRPDKQNNQVEEPKPQAEEEPKPQAEEEQEL